MAAAGRGSRGSSGDCLPVDGDGPPRLPHAWGRNRGRRVPAVNDVTPRLQEGRGSVRFRRPHRPARRPLSQGDRTLEGRYGGRWGERTAGRVPAARGRPGEFGHVRPATPRRGRGLRHLGHVVPGRATRGRPVPVRIPQGRRAARDGLWAGPRAPVRDPVRAERQDTARVHPVRRRRRPAEVRVRRRRPPGSPRRRARVTCIVPRSARRSS